ncbi:MAG: hypothetical protein KF819_01325 [Labilithrix sp.]|nr:hypothetical protein [Labilithrix sp.]
MTRKRRRGEGLILVLVLGSFGAASEARADDATVTVGGQGQRFSDPPEPRANPVAVDDPGYRRYDFEPRELRRSPFRLTLGPAGITTGKGFGVGVGVGADFGAGSVGGRLSVAWLRGEGTNANGTSTPTGDSVGLYSGELTLDLHKRGPVHPIIGMGLGFLRVSRPDTSGWAGMGTTRLGVEYALGLDDADVRVGASVTGGLIGPVDSDVKDLKAYALTGIHLAIGF